MLLGILPAQCEPFAGGKAHWKAAVKRGRYLDFSIWHFFAVSAPDPAGIGGGP
jgi:hypothetical protein